MEPESEEYLTIIRQFQQEWLDEQQQLELLEIEFHVNDPIFYINERQTYNVGRIFSLN